MNESEAFHAGGFAPRVAPRMASHGDKARHTWARLDALDMHHLVQQPLSQWMTAPSVPEERLLATLRSSVEYRVRSCNDPARLGTALTYLEMFSTCFPSRPGFMKRGGANDWLAASFNNETFELLAEFIRQNGSIQPGKDKGKQLPASTIGEYISALKAAFDAEMRGPLTSGDGTGRRKRLFKHMTIEDGPVVTQQRKRRLGFRGRFFHRVASSAQFDRASASGAYKWMLSLAMYYLMLRPGEAGRGKGTKPFNVARGIKLSDIVWWDSSVTQDKLPAVCFMLVSSKPGPDGKYRRSPCECSQRVTPDALCFYTQFVAYWRARSRAVCRRRDVCVAAPFCPACASEPLFCSPEGVVPTTDTNRALAREMCGAIGESAEEYTGYSWRIGFATDLVENYGAEPAKLITQRRGRWAEGSDIYWIYVRTGVDEQLRASRHVIDTQGTSIESLVPQWQQPARRWR